MRIKPLADRVLLEITEAENKTKSGIVLPDSVEEKKLIRGKVMETGPGRINDSGTRIPMSVKTGDEVMFRKPYGADEIEENGKKYTLVDESDIVGIIEK